MNHSPESLRQNKVNYVKNRIQEVDSRFGISSPAENIAGPIGIDRETKRRAAETLTGRYSLLLPLNPTLKTAFGLEADLHYLGSWFPSSRELMHGLLTVEKSVLEKELSTLHKGTLRLHQGRQELRSIEEYLDLLNPAAWSEVKAEEVLKRSSDITRATRSDPYNPDLTLNSYLFNFLIPMNMPMPEHRLVIIESGKANKFIQEVGLKIKTPEYDPSIEIERLIWCRDIKNETNIVQEYGGKIEANGLFGHEVNTPYEIWKGIFERHSDYLRDIANNEGRSSLDWKHIANWSTLAMRMAVDEIDNKTAIDYCKASEEGFNLADYLASKMLLPEELSILRDQIAARKKTLRIIAIDQAGNNSNYQDSLEENLQFLRAATRTIL